MNDEVYNLIVEAMRKIRSGDVEAGLLVLERTIHPKFGSSEEAEGALAMFSAEGPKDHVRDFFAMALGHSIAAADAQVKTARDAA